MQKSLTNPPTSAGDLPRNVGGVHAATLNVLHMVGIGPFITLPLLLATMNGAPALAGWVLGALLASCDGLIWAELGSALPKAGGPYAYLQTAFGASRTGRCVVFLFVWQILLTAPLSLAAGAVGLAAYTRSLFSLPARSLPVLAMGMLALCLLLLYRNLARTRGLSFLMGGCLVAVIALLFSATSTHLALYRVAPLLHWAQWPHGAAALEGLSKATRFAMYDYAGYWTVNYFASEVRRPERVIPRATLWSIGAVALLYWGLTTVVVMALPMSSILRSHAIITRVLTAAAGSGWADAATVLILIVGIASLFAGMLGYSRVPFAAAQDGNFFALFARVHRRQFPAAAVTLTAVLAMGACLFPLSRIIEYLVVLQILMKFLPQIAAQFALRRSGLRLPFRTPLFPATTLLALSGWLLILLGASRASLLTALVLVVCGILLFFLWEAAERRRPIPAPGE